MLNRDPVVQELSRRFIAERGVAATPIVERFDVSKEISDRLVPRRVTHTVHALVLQAVEEALCTKRLSSACAGARMKLQKRAGRSACATLDLILFRRRGHAEE